MYVFTVIGIQKSLFLFQVHHFLKNLCARDTIIGESMGRKEMQGYDGASP